MERNYSNYFPKAEDGVEHRTKKTQALRKKFGDAYVADFLYRISTTSKHYTVYFRAIEQLCIMNTDLAKKYLNKILSEHSIDKYTDISTRDLAKYKRYQYDDDHVFAVLKNIGYTKDLPFLRIGIQYLEKSITLGSDIHLVPPDDSGPSVVGALTPSWTKYGKTATPVFIETLKARHHKDVHLAVLHMLYKIKDPAAIPALAEVLNSTSDSDITFNIISIIENTGGQEAIRVLRSFSERWFINSNVRQEAENAVERLESK